MKTAEYLASACARLCEENLGKGACEQCIAQALTAFALQARQQALSEAADICDQEDSRVSLTARISFREMAERIRALKWKP